MNSEISYLEIISAFAKRLIEAKNTEEALDFVISEAISKLGYEDFVIYLYKTKRFSSSKSIRSNSKPSH